MMIRKSVLLLCFVIALAVGFVLGHLYQATKISSSAEMEDYALTNVIEDVGYIHFLSKGDYVTTRSLIDVALTRHLSYLREHRTGAADAEFDAVRTRTLNRVAALWERHPPFQSEEWRRSESNAFWWDEWNINHKKNLAMLQEAKAQCSTNPALKCSSQAWKERSVIPGP